MSDRLATLWRSLGVDPSSDAARLIELTVRLDALRDLASGFNALRAQHGVAPLVLGTAPQPTAPVASSVGPGNQSRRDQEARQGPNGAAPTIREGNRVQAV